MNTEVESSTLYRLGLDVGTNSIGWAAISLDGDGKPCGILDMGVRIFPDGRNPTDKTSNAVNRRLARGQRRRRDRYLKRRGKLIKTLIEFGLMPAGKEERGSLAKSDPYKRRAGALDRDRPLGPFELGRALFHLNQRRGFKSNRKAGGDDESEAQTTRAEIDALRKSIRESEARTLGEFLAERHEKGKKGEKDGTVRARPGHELYPDRALYEAEFDAIRCAQKPHHPNLSDSQWDRLKDIIFFQRPLKPVDPGWCLFERGEKRAAKALPIAQEFRMLQEVNNLKIVVGFEPERPLNDEERARALERLRAGNPINLEKPTQNLRLPVGATFNLSIGGRKSVKGDETSARLVTAKKEKGERKAKDIFGSRWHALSLDERNEIAGFLIDTEEPEAVRQKAREDWGLNDAQAKALSEISLPDGYANLSEKAMRKLLPHLESGLVYSEAVKAAGYSHHSDFREGEAQDSLPYYGEVLERDAVGADPTKDPEKDGEVARYGRIANPTVHIGLGQIRRVVNRLIEVYGKPEEIVVELARELKLNRDQIRELERRNREGGERNERFREMLESAEQGLSADTLQRLRLWEEQGPEHARLCPYTGKPISFEMAVSSRTEVDHILPFSKTLDNSISNKVLCLAGTNRTKGDRSPYEAFGHNPPGYDYQEILAWSDKLPDNKKWRFKEDAMERFDDESAFLDRQLNETKYLSRTARTYLSHLYDEKTSGRQRVRVIPGRMTALLRRGWGIEGMLRESENGEPPRKSRDDHRHHAIDALVVANTTQGLLQQFASASASADSADATERLASMVPLPWDGFHRNEVQPFLDRMVVSYKQDHGTRGGLSTTGQLHNATAYGLIEPLEDGSYKVVIRKNLDKLKKKDLESDAIRDPLLRKALLRLWEEVESLEGKANPAKFAERANTKGVLIAGKRQRVRRVRVVDKQRVIPIKNESGKTYKGYLPGGNEFAEVWRMLDGKWKTVVVPAFEANQPGFDPTKFRPHPAAKKLMRLQIDDMGALGKGESRRIVRVRKIDAGSGGRVVMDDHNEANVPDRIKQDMRMRRETGVDTGMKEEVFSAQKLRRLGFRKIGVDEIGRVRDPGPLK